MSPSPAISKSVPGSGICEGVLEHSQQVDPCHCLEMLSVTLAPFSAAELEFS